MVRIMTEDKKAPKSTKKEPSTVKMVRYDGKTADVHASEIENYRKGGYKEAK